MRSFLHISAEEGEVSLLVVYLLLYLCIVRICSEKRQFSKRFLNERKQPVRLHFFEFPASETKKAGVPGILFC